MRPEKKAPRPERLWVEFVNLGKDPFQRSFAAPWLLSQAKEDAKMPAASETPLTPTQASTLASGRLLPPGGCIA